jgi:ribosomal protein S25
MGGNDPITPAPIETQPAPAPVETPVATVEPVLVETTVLEVTPPETTQPTQTETVIEPTLAQTTTEVTSVAQVETPAPAPVVTQTQTSTSAQVVASVVAPVVAPVIAQTFTKSIRELFTKAQLAIQNRKRKKIDRILTLFAKQAMITNNEVEKLLHISDSTATRYLSTLEKEGKIKQNTKKGHTTSYSKI